MHININLPAVTRETQRQLRTSRKNLSIFLTLGRRAIPFTLAGGAALTGGLLCRVVLLGIHVSSCVSSRLEKKGGNDDGLSAAFQHPGQRSQRHAPLIQQPRLSTSRRTRATSQSAFSLTTALAFGAASFASSVLQMCSKTLPDLRLLLLLLLVMLEVVLSSARLLLLQSETCWLCI